MSAAGLATVPIDAALPFLGPMLDPAAAAQLLGSEPGAVRVRSLRYKPGRRLVVEYDVGTAPARTAVAAVDRKAGPFPVVQWYPIDADLPALRLQGPELAAALGIAPAAVERLGYKPFARAALRLGDRVVKLYASARKLHAAASALGQVTGTVPGAGFLGLSESLRATVQAFVPGERPEALQAAGEAGALLAGIHRLDPESLRCVGPGRRLAEARRAATLVAAVLPEVATRAVALARRLEGAAPKSGEPVTSHGDFEPGQLIRSGDGLVLVDFDELCASAPADDLAWYGAHAARGRTGDEEAVEAVLDALVAGYGGRPDDLAWYVAASILARAPFPFRRQHPYWPDRVDRLVAAAEAFS
jgi:aminoglycoside phosphotransferase (APT) family kinase protein